MTRIRFVMLGLLLAGPACNALAGCAARGPSVPPEPEAASPKGYVIGPADELRVTVWQNSELSGAVPVRPDGKISIPLLDDVQAAGLTPLELKEQITGRLREYIGQPDVTVTVLHVASHQVFVLGELARQGPIPLTRSLRVLDAISIAGGFSPFADTDDIRVLRRTDEGVAEYRFDYDAYLTGRAPESNLLLRSGDTIVVPQ
jgi:polysaccharide export outer membrane protein